MGFPLQLWVEIEAHQLEGFFFIISHPRRFGLVQFTIHYKAHDFGY